MSLSDGIHHLRSLEVGTDPKPAWYATMGATNVEVAPLDKSNKKQEWSISRKADGSFSIVNVATGQSIFPVAPTPSDRDYRILGDTSPSAMATTWTLELQKSSNAYLIIAPGSFSPEVIDLSIDNRVILWERNLHANQMWGFDLVTPPKPILAALKSGRYRIRNKDRTSPTKYLHLKDNKEVAVQGLDCASVSQAWDVTANPDGSYNITNVATSDPFAGKEWQPGSFSLRGDTGTAKWTLTAEGGNAFSIHAVGQFSPKVVDLADGDWVILWDPNDLPRQHWLFEAVDDPNGPCKNAFPPPNPPGTHEGHPATRQPRPEDWKTYLKNYHIIFVLDDSSSMTNDGSPRWDNAREVLKPVAQEAYTAHADTVDVQFLNQTSGNSKAVSAPEVIVRLFDQRRPPEGEYSTPTAPRLKEILDAALAELNAAVSIPALYKTVRPFDIILITDGVPDDYHENPQKVFEQTWKELKAGKHDDNYIGIQLVQIGDDPDASAWLKKAMTGDFGSIVDSFPYDPKDGDLTYQKLRRILLGGIQPSVRNMRK